LKLGYRFKKLVLFLSNEIHGYESDSETTYVCIVFSPSWISPFLKMIKGKQPAIPKFLMGELEVAYLKKIDQMSHQSIKMQGWLLLVCGTFLEQVDWEERSEENADLVTVIIDYIGRHYLEELTLRQLAKELGYDHFYLSHFIGKNIGTTFHQYLTSLRLAHSLDLLKTTDEKISTIAYQSGFPSTRTFNTHFKREFNQTPREYLQKQRKG